MTKGMRMEMRTETWIPGAGIIRVNDGPWLSEAMLPLPVGGPTWLAAVRYAVEEAGLFKSFPDGHVVTDDEHLLVIRQAAACKLLREHSHEIISGLLVAVNATKAPTPAPASSPQNPSSHPSQAGEPRDQPR